MSSGAMAAYLLSLDEKVVAVHETMEAAQAAAKEHMATKKPLKITFAGAALAIVQNREWHYDYECSLWVELIK